MKVNLLHAFWTSIFVNRSLSQPKCLSITSTTLLSTVSALKSPTTRVKIKIIPCSRLTGLLTWYAETRTFVHTIVVVNSNIHRLVQNETRPVELLKGGAACRTDLTACCSFNWWSQVSSMNLDSGLWWLHNSTNTRRFELEGDPRS
jgi:hypothetical protein